MRKWRALPGERLEMYSPIGLIPTDFFTSREPLGRVKVLVDFRESSGQWRETDIKEVRTAGGVIAFPGLRRSSVDDSKPPDRYRVRVEAEFYLPLYTETGGGTLEGIEFDVFPYNDTVPPSNYPTKAIDFPAYLKSVLKQLWLVPAPNYAFPTHVPVLRGFVVDLATRQPVDRAEVRWGLKEKALTNEKGAFALPLRVKEAKHLIEDQKFDANDRQPILRQGVLEKIKIPDAIKSSQTIPIS